MTHPPTPWQPDPGAFDPDDLPEVFHRLVGIDVIDGELVPRASKPPSFPAAS